MSAPRALASPTLAPVRARAPRRDPAPKPAQRAAGASVGRIALLAVVSVVIVLAALVYTQITISEDAVRRSEIEARTAIESVRIELLRAEVAGLESPARITEEAARLGLVVPANVEFLRLGSHSVR